jgi:DNA polymerase-3 subunit delta'
VPADHPAFRKVAAGAHPNLLVLERPYDEDRKRFRTELTVPEIRRTVSFFGSTAGEPGWRIAIVDPADDMNDNAVNALLKVLEEPPRRSLFLIVSHAPGRMPPTLRSRCRRLDLKPLPAAAIVAAIRANGVAAGDDDLELASALADGSLRRAIFLIDSGGIDLYRRLNELLARLPAVDIPGLHDFADSVSGRGDDDAWTGFHDLLEGWLTRRVRNQPEPGRGPPLAPAVEAAPLERWAEVWENLRRSSTTADDLNLDRKRTVLSILMSLARATRM